MSAGWMIGAGTALLVGFLFAGMVLFMAIFGGGGEDVGYSTWEDVGAGTGDTGSGDYDTVDTYMQSTGVIMHVQEGNRRRSV